MTLLQVVLYGRRHVGTSTVHVGRHLVQSRAIVVVLQLSEWLHGSVKIVVDDGKPVAAVVEGFPSWVVQVLGVVGKVHALLQHVLATHRRKRVEVDAYYQVGVVANERHKLVVNLFLVELQLLKLSVLKVEVVIGIVVQRSGVRRAVNGAVGLHHSLACEDVGRVVVLCNRDVEVARYALVLLKLQTGPLALVDKSCQILFYFLKHAGVSALYLRVVDGYLGVKLLCTHLGYAHPSH